MNFDLLKKERVEEANEVPSLVFDLFVSLTEDGVSVQIDNEHMTDDMYCGKKNTVYIHRDGEYYTEYSLSEEKFKPLVDFLRKEGYVFGSEDDTTEEGYFSYQIKMK